MVVVPGNHDARNVGYLHFERYFGDRFSRYREIRRGARERARRAPASRSSPSTPPSPTSTRDRSAASATRGSASSSPIRTTSRSSSSTITSSRSRAPDASATRSTTPATCWPSSSQLGVDIVLSGHKHVPYFWGISGLLICNSGTATTKRLRGLTPQSWTEIEVNEIAINGLSALRGRAPGAVLRSHRETRAMVREGFYITEAFLMSNHLLPG